MGRRERLVATAQKGAHRRADDGERSGLSQRVTTGEGRWLGFRFTRIGYLVLLS